MGLKDRSYRAKPALAVSEPGTVIALPDRTSIRTLPMSEVPEGQVDWLWKPFFPLGMMTFLHGDPGLGKSALLCDLVAKLSQGDEMPNGAEPRPVASLMLIGDDDVGKTVKPRLRAAGARLELVTALFDVEEFDDAGESRGTRPLSLIRDIHMIRDVIAETGAELMVVDPLLAFFGADRDTNSVSDVAEAMYKLKELAEVMEVAIVLNTWNSKNSTGRALARLMGSTAFSGSVRAAFLVDEHPDDPGLMVFACSKMNIAAKPTSQTFRVVGTRLHNERCGEIETAKIEWEGATDLRAEDLAPKQEPRKAAASVWLLDRLSGGGVERNEILAAGKAAGFSESTLARARQEIGAVPVRTADFPSKTVWQLSDA